MTESEAFLQAHQVFGRYVGQIKDDQWELPTPDSEWNVRQLVNHLTSETLWVVDLVAGKTIAEVGDKYDGDLLGDDPKAAWQRAMGASDSAVKGATDMTQIVHLSFGDTPLGEYLKQMAIDHTIHAWDLARAIEADEDLGEPLVAKVYTWFEPQAEGWRGTGALAEAVTVSDGADIQTKLLALSGRHP